MASDRRGRARRDPRPAHGLALELLNRKCDLAPYTKLSVPASKVDGEIVAYASPDSTFAVTKRLIDGAKKSVLIGTYDFTATYVADLLTNAVARGVKVELMLDLDNRSGEQPLYDSLKAAGVKTHPAPACGPGHAHFFPSCHEKVTVIDGEWVLVQSGNYTENSIPPNDPTPGSAQPHVPGNRDMGLAIRSKSLAAFFTKVVKADIKLAAKPPSPQELAPVVEPEVLLFESAPTAVPKVVADKRFKVSAGQTVQAVVTPDNFLEAAADLLAGATKTIDIEEQYIRPSQPQVGRLLTAIKAARATNHSLKVRIVLAAGYGGDDTARLRKELAELSEKHDLPFGQRVRLLNKKYFVHCHNKLIVVDGERVLVGSQNWSDTGVSQNREAGILLTHKGIAEYFTGLVDFDWKTGVKTLPKPKPVKPHELGPVGLRVRYGDYADV